MWKGLLCAVCLFWAGSTGAASAQTVTEPDSIFFTSVGEQARVRLYRVSGNKLRPARSPNWSSTDPSVAMVAETSGWVTALTHGEVWIVATSRDGADSAYVSVDTGPLPLLAPQILSLDGADTLGVVTVGWGPVEGAESYQLDAGGSSVPPISIPTTDLTASFQMEQTATAYEGWVCVNGLRGDEVGPDACEVFQVPAAPLPPLEMPTGVQLLETVQADSVFYTFTWDAMATADGYEWGAGPNDWDGGVQFRGPTWQDVSTTNLVTDFHQVRDLEDYTSWVCVRSTRGEEISENSCLSIDVPLRPADSVVVYMKELPPEVVYLGVNPADTLRPDTTVNLWGWDTDDGNLQVKAVALGVEFELCAEVWFKGTPYLGREATWQIIPVEGPTDLVLMLGTTSPDCMALQVNPTASAESMKPFLTWLADRPSRRER